MDGKKHDGKTGATPTGAVERLALCGCTDPSRAVRLVLVLHIVTQCNVSEYSDFKNVFTFLIINKLQGF